MASTWHSFQAGGWAMWVLWMWFGLGLGSMLMLAWWFRRLWRRRRELRLRSWILAVVLAAVALTGGLGTLVGLVMAFGAVGGESIDPSQKARMLAEGISEAMNCTAFGALFGVPSAIVLAFLTRKRRQGSS
jgi:biopolymer transport protein ExbB/TolQ